jgi:hypothetical protein
MEYSVKAHQYSEKAKAESGNSAIEARKTRRAELVTAAGKRKKNR